MDCATVLCHIAAATPVVVPITTPPVWNICTSREYNTRLAIHGFYGLRSWVFVRLLPTLQIHFVAKFQLTIIYARKCNTNLCMMKPF
jgi:hypothetical protein